MAPARELPEGPVTIMFTDIEGSTALRTSVGDAAADALFTQHDELIRDLIAQHRGQDLQAALGDGFLAIFASTKRAVTCAVAIQQELERFNRGRPGPALRVRIGLNTGEVAWQGDQPSGEAIHAASRVCGSASGGDVFVSDVTRQLAGTMPDIAFTDRGEFDLKGFPQPWKLWSLSWRAGPAEVAHDVFVSRDKEMAELRTRLRDAIDGKGSLVLIGGEPGVGKTSLVRQLIKEAEQAGAIALFGRCYESSGTVPYSPFVETTEQALRVVPPEWVREDLGDAAAEVARMVPELRRRFPDIGEPLDLPTEQQRRYFFNAISDFITRGSQRVPIVLIADDAHWADEPTLLLLEHVAELLPSLRILAVGTYRDVELDVSRPLAATLDRLTRARLAHRISLKRFDKAAVSQLLEAQSGRTPPQGLVELIFSETEGNAFFVDEVFRHLVEEGKVFDDNGDFLSNIDIDELDVPESVRLVVGRRVERLGEAAQRVLAAGAVVGRGFEFSLLERISDVPVDTLLDVVDDAERARVIVPEDRGGRIYYTFGHELIRQTLLASLSLPRRQRLHLAVAAALEETDPAIVDTRPSEIANHLVQAGTAADQTKTLSYLLRSAKRALEAAAFEEAMWATEAALDLVGREDDASRLDVQEQQGWAERGLKHFERCIEIFAEVAEGRARAGNPEAAGRLLWENGYQLVWLGRFEDAFSTYARGLELVGDEPSAARADLLGGMATLAGFAGLHEASEAGFAESIAMAEKIGDVRTMARTQWGHCVALWSMSRVNAALQAGETALRYAREINDVWTLVDALTWLAFPYAIQGKSAKGLTAAVEARDLAAKIGHQGGLMLAERGVVFADFLTGYTPDRMLQAGEDDLRRMQQINSPWISQSHAWIASAHNAKGTLDEGLDFAERAAVDEPPGAWNGAAFAFLFLNRVYAGDTDKCRALLDEWLPRLPRTFATTGLGAACAVQCVAEGCAILGWAEDAEQFTPLLAELDEEFAIRIFDGAMVRRVQAMVATASQDWDRAEERFESALAQAATLHMDSDLGHVWFRYGQMLVRRGHPEDVMRARDLLTRALQRYRDWNMARFAAEAEATLAELP